MITLILKKASEDWYFSLERYASFVHFKIMSLAGPRLAKDSRIILGFAFLQVYYELDDERKKVGSSDVAICRVEEFVLSHMISFSVSLSCVGGLFTSTHFYRAFVFSSSFLFFDRSFAFEINFFLKTFYILTVTRNHCRMGSQISYDTCDHMGKDKLFHSTNSNIAGPNLKYLQHILHFYIVWYM